MTFWGGRRKRGYLVERLMIAFAGHLRDVEFLEKRKERKEFWEWLLLAIVLALFCFTRAMICAVCAKIMVWHSHLWKEFLRKPVHREPTWRLLENLSGREPLKLEI
jgi:hypothetical protein